MFLTALVVPHAEAAACERASTTSQLSALLGAAEVAWEKRDRPAVVAAADTALGELACLRDSVTPALAARFHRVTGLRAFLLQDDGSAIRSFAAARSLEPNYVLPTALVPQAHPARILYDMAPVAIASFAPIPAVQGILRLDGRDLQARPTDRPVIFQLFDDSGSVVTTFCLQASDPLPPLPPPLTPALAAVSSPAPVAMSPATVAVVPLVGMGVAGHRGPNKPLIYGALGGLVVSGVLYGVAGAVQGDYAGLEQVADNEAEFESLYATNHGLIVGAGVTATLSVALGAAAFVVRW